ncbi:MAG: hypothetical protein K2H72_06540, partial [Muribaculaceae bacterium]|nr:hypothetical protein [Muribaculaceae bacterium]
MFRLESINIYIRPLYCAIALLIITAINCTPACASVTGAPLFTTNENYLTDNTDISVFIDHERDKDAVYRQYSKLEQECRPFSISEIMTKAAHHFVNRKNMEKGAMLFMVAISRYDDSLDDREKLYSAAAYGNMGYYLIFEKNNPIQAYPFLVKALQILDNINFKDSDTQSHKINTIVAVYTNIAKIFAACGDSSRALRYYQHAYSTAKEENNPIAIPLAFTDLLHYGWTLDSLQSIKNEIKEFNSLKVPSSAYRFMHDYAKLMAKAAQRMSERNYDEALSLVDSASNALDPYVDDRRYFVMNRIIAGNIAFHKKDYAKASIILSIADSIVREGKLEDLYEKIHELHSGLSLAKGNVELAQRHRNEGLRVRDSLNRMHSYSVLRNMELSLQTKDLNDRLSDSRKKTRIWTYIALGAVTLILVICVLIVRILIKNRRLKEQSESLFRKNLELMNSERKPQLLVPENKATIQEKQNEPIETISQEASQTDEDASDTYRRILA